MNKRLLLAGLFALATTASWAQYPIKTVKELNFVPQDSLLLTPPKDASPLIPVGQTFGDTVSIYCVVYEPSRQEDGRQTFFTGSRFRFVVMDSSALVSKDYDFAFGTFISLDSTSANPSGAGELVKGQIIKVTGRANEFRGLTQFELIGRSDAIEVVGFANLADLPSSIPVEIGEMNKGTWSSNSSVNQKKATSEKYESAKVRLKGLTVISNRSAEFLVQDSNGDQIQIDDQGNRIFGTTPPPPGSTIDSLDGYLFTYDNSGTWCVNPVNYAAIYGIQSDVPVISGYENEKTYFGPQDSVKMTWNITTGNPNSVISSAKLFYTVNNSETVQELDMVKTDAGYVAAIAPVELDSALVEFYAEAKIGAGAPVRFPSAGLEGVWVSADEPSIQMVQYSEKLNGDTYFIGAVLTLEGIIVSSASQMGVGSAVVMQNGSGPWSGIRLSGSKIDTFQVGDRVRVTGTVGENFNLTRLVYVTTGDFEILSKENPLPAFFATTTDAIKTGSSTAEAHESILVELTEPFVVNLNADAPTNSNFGEVVINEDSTKTGTFSGARMDDLSRTTLWANVERAGKSIFYPGQKFEYLRGFMDFSFSEFKLIPRDSLDMGQTKAPVSVKEDGIAKGIELYPAYPNPFNPSTTIRFSINTAASVELVVFNTLGQQVATLVNGNLQPSTYRMNFNASGLASGLYFYQLRVDNQIVETAKMTLIK